MKIKILTAKELDQVLPMSLAIEAMRDAFTQHAVGKVQMPLRVATEIPSQEAVMLAMPAYATNMHSLGIKIVSVFPNNSTLQKPSVNGLVLMFDAISGVPNAIINGAALTAIRTGAASGLATDLLARTDANTLAIIGSGPQAYTQLEAMLCVRNIKRLYIYSRNQRHAEKFASQLSFQGTIHICTQLKEATLDADIICTATSAQKAFLDLEAVKPGVHINAIGSHTAKMSELTTSLLANAIVIVDDRQAALAEAGEIINAIKTKSITKETLIELGEVITKARSGRQQATDITVFKSVGLAIQDICAAQAALKNSVDITTVSI